MKKKRTVGIGAVLMLIFLTAVATFNITFFISAEYYSMRLSNLQELEGRYKKLKEVADYVEAYFVGDYDEQALIDGAVAGYIDALGDRWSGYYSAEQTQAMMEEDENSYVGVGITISNAEDSAYQIISVTRGGPAQQAGIQPFDVLLAVDGVAVRDFATYDDMVNAVRGEAGTEVGLTVLRGEETLEFAVTRAEVYNEQIEIELLPGNVGYMSIAGFENNVDVEFAAKLQELIDQGATSLIFDVRFNPGGYVEVMCNMLDKLLPEGTIISMSYKEGKTQNYKSDADCVQMPMAVITNAYSVSAAEFFAAALQEYGVATVVGESTGGKGFAQNLITLEDGSSINLSTARYYTPKGVSLAGVGITPDREVIMSEEDLYNFYELTREQDVQLQEAIAVVAPGAGSTPAPGTETPAAPTENGADATPETNPDAVPPENTPAQ